MSILFISEIPFESLKTSNYLQLSTVQNLAHRKLSNHWDCDGQSESKMAFWIKLSTLYSICTLLDWSNKNDLIEKNYHEDWRIIIFFQNNFLILNFLHWKLCHYFTCKPEMFWKLNFQLNFSNNPKPLKPLHNLHLASPWCFIMTLHLELFRKKLTSSSQFVHLPT